MTSCAPEPKALLAAAQYIDETWNSWAEAESGDKEFAEVEQAIGSLRRVLDGTRRMGVSKDQYGFWRTNCRDGCGWPGSPWSDGRYDMDRLMTGREMAVREYARHVCNEVGKGTDR